MPQKSMVARGLRNRSFRPCVHSQSTNDIAHKVRKMARTLVMAQRDSSESRFLLDSEKPFLNHRLEFTFENVRHRFHRGSTVARFGPHRKLKRFGHYNLPRRSLWFIDFIDWSG